MSILVVILLTALIAPVVLLLLPTTWIAKWLTLGMAALFLVGAWLQAAQSDIPPCHMMLPFALWTAAAYRHWLRPTKKPCDPGCCENCGYNLTGNTSGVCPECGSSLPKQKTRIPPTDGRG